MTLLQEQPVIYPPHMCAGNTETVHKRKFVKQKCSHEKIVTQKMGKGKVAAQVCYLLYSQVKLMFTLKLIVLIINCQ